MPVDANIAMGVRPIELENPLNQFAKVMAIQNAQNQNELAQYNLSSARRNDEVNNSFLRDIRAAGDDPALVKRAYYNAGKPDAYAKLQEDQAKAGHVAAQTSKIASELIDASIERFRSVNPPLAAAQAGPEGVVNYVKAMYADDTLGRLSARVKPLEQAIDENLKLYAKDPAQWTAAMSGLKGDNVVKVLTGTPYTENLGNVSRRGVTDFTGKVVGTPIDTPIGVSPNTVATNERIAQEGALNRAQARQFHNEAQAEKAPTLTTIVDPTDQTKMITIDARTYKGGGYGAPGVIGVSGKEPGAALRENKLEKGRSEVLDTTDTMQALLDELNDAGAIPSTSRGAVSNIASSAATSTPGQVVARMVGSESQAKLDTLKSLRSQLLLAVKNATGMTAQQMNSNVELKTWMDALGSDSMSYEARSKILENMKQRYGLGEKVPSREASGAIKPTGAPKAGTVQDGYRFKGGDPAQKSNWEKV